MSTPRLVIFCLCIPWLAAACRSSNPAAGSSSAGIIVINSPATGEVRRVLISEDVEVAAGAPILEIAVETPAVSANTPEDSRGSAATAYQSAQKAVTAAEQENERAAVEVQRVSALVASSSAPQSQLDAARAQYQQTQMRLQQARSALASAQESLASQQGNSDGARPAPTEQIIAARAPSAGTVAVINARVGQHVTTGQPLATLRAASP